MTAGGRRPADDLLVREKAHTREGDAIAAARPPAADGRGGRPPIPLTGEHGPVPLLDVFEGRRQLIVYSTCGTTASPRRSQCEGCTFFNGQVRELSYLHSRDVTYAHVLRRARTRRASAYRDFMGWDAAAGTRHQDSADALLAGRWFGMLVVLPARTATGVFETYWTSGRAAEAMAPAYPMLDLTVYGRQETWEDSPAGWPQRFGTGGDQFRTDGRPTAQWPRLAAGFSDNLGAG